MTQTTEPTSFLFEGPMNVTTPEPELLPTTVILLPKAYVEKELIGKVEGYFLIVGVRCQAYAIEIDANALETLVSLVAATKNVPAKKAVLALAATEKDLRSKGLSIFSVHSGLPVDA